MERTKSKEELMSKFLEMVEADTGKEPTLYKYLNRIIYDLFDLGEKGFQPTFAFTIFMKVVGEEFELLFRPIRTPSIEVYEGFKLERLAVLLNEAIEKYCEEVWGMKPERENKFKEG